MPYDIKSKLGRRGFWFILESNERTTVDEAYVFKAKVTIKGKKAPLLTLDSRNPRHVFLYKTITTSGDGQYERVSQVGLDIDQLPCIVAFHADLPPGLEVTASVQVSDWRSDDKSDKGELNVREFTKINEVRMAFIRWNDQGAAVLPTPLLDVFALEPVPVVLLEGPGYVEASKLDDFKPSTQISVYDWTGLRPTVQMNGKKLAEKPVWTNERHPSLNTGRNKHTEDLPIPHIWRWYPPKETLQPRLEAVASNGTYSGGAYIKYLAQSAKNSLSGFAAASGQSLPIGPGGAAFGDDDLFEWAFGKGRSADQTDTVPAKILGTSLPFAPPPRRGCSRYAFRICVIGEPIITTEKSLDDGFDKRAGGQLEMAGSSVGSAWLASIGTGESPTKRRMPLRDPKTGTAVETDVYIHRRYFQTRPLICIQALRNKQNLLQQPQNQGTIVCALGELLSATIRRSEGVSGVWSSGKKSNPQMLLAGALGCSPVARCAGFRDLSVLGAVDRKDTSTGTHPSLTAYTWRSESVKLTSAKGHTPGVSEEQAKKPLSVSVNSEEGTISFVPSVRSFYGESTHLRRYGCEEFHPVRLWLLIDEPWGVKHPEPLLRLSREKILSACAKLSEDKPLSIAGLPEDKKFSMNASWPLLYAIYLSGHLNGSRLGHPSPSDMTILFDGWPGLLPTFLLKGLHLKGIVSVPDHANICDGRNILDCETAKELLKESDAQAGRFKSTVNENIRSSLKRQRDVRIYNGWNPIETARATFELALYLKDHPECEAVSLGGYSIGTNRALWMANALKGKFRVYLPKSRALSEGKLNLAEVKSGEVLGKSYKPWDVNDFNLYDVIHRNICVNNLVFMDFNFGSATFLPYTTGYSIPATVRQVHHLYSAGKLAKGRNHYMYWPSKLRGLEIMAILQGLQTVPETRKALARLLVGHPDILGVREIPKNVIEHTRNLWETYDKKFQKPIHFPEKGIADLDLGKLADLFEKDLFILFEYLETRGGCPKKHKQTIRNLRNDLINKKSNYIEDIAKRNKWPFIEFMSWFTRDLILRAILNPTEWMGFVTFIVTLVNLVRELYLMADTHMMLAYSEDGVSNSSGGGFIFKSTGRYDFCKGTGLLHPGASYYQLDNIDHLEMGSDQSKKVSTDVRNIMFGESGHIR